jgi:hypothetical protein
VTLNHPAVLGSICQASLLVSSVTGLLAIRIDHPLLRISALIAVWTTFSQLNDRLMPSQRWIMNPWPTFWIVVVLPIWQLQP